MKVVVKHLQRDKKTGLLSYRRRFPTELVPYIPSNSPNGKGRTELKVSLRSANMSDVVARRLYAEAEQRFEAIVAKAQRVASRAFDSLDDALIRYLKEKYLYDHLECDEAMRWRRKQSPPTYETRGHPCDVYEESRSLLEEYDSKGLVAYWGQWATVFAEVHGYLVDPADPHMLSLCKAIAEAACEVWLKVDKRIDGKVVVTPAAPEAPRKVLDPQRRRSGDAEAVSLLELFEKYASLPGRHLKTIRQWRPYIQNLVDFLGTDDALAMTHDDLVRWRNFLRDEYTYKGERLSAKTINGSYMGAASALFSWARGDNLTRAQPFSRGRATS